MYPTISHLIEDLLGIHIPLPIATFGFFLILAIYTGGIALAREMRAEVPVVFSTSCMSQDTMSTKGL